MSATSAPPSCPPPTTPTSPTPSHQPRPQTPRSTKPLTREAPQRAVEIIGVDSDCALALNPSLRAAPLEFLHAVISYLLAQGIHHKDMARIFGMCPDTLIVDIRADLAPVFCFPARDLGIPAANFLCVEYLALELGHYSTLLTVSVENNFSTKYLVGEMGRGPQELQDFPKYFAFSLEKWIKCRHRDMEA
ncbi:hypothetical protein Taro_011129 [Colocasia esculenta]|uniref:Uncharacterized protein n=1 Tax=Colocasia esculenta TaxID=4460 RepID=A0A843U4Z3_COLES|nr:hypothetical protein [Colocasia esculenta]